MDNFCSYFTPERRVFLENVSYETLGVPNTDVKARRLGCRDTVIAQLILPAGVKIVFNRRLSFEPEAHFTLSVSFGVFMLFDRESGADDVDWKCVNIVEEFTKSCPAALADLSARTALLVAQITSASGGTPLIAAAPTPMPPTHANQSPDSDS